jgi:hypothetical protein
VMISRGCPVVAVYSMMLLGLVGLTTGCTSAGQGPSAGQGHPSLPPNCTHTITRTDDLAGILAAVSPGTQCAFPGPTSPTPT